VGYRGTAYAGWAVQAGQVTVQSTLEAGLAEALGHPVHATAAGRTDAGVHADAQVLSFETTSTMPSSSLVQVLPRWLPHDIWPIEASDARASFDARRAARRRWYRYALWRGEVPTSNWHGRSLVVTDDLDVRAMRNAARSLLGKRDFGGFATQPPSGGSTKRTVFAADWLEYGPLLQFEIAADAFLKHMVRGIVGGLMWVGRGHWTIDQFTQAIETADRRDAGPNAPPIGLTLFRIEY
jgi:tRNA pseudouridine38-40 synthase